MASKADAKECQIRIRIHPDIMPQIETRAKELGYIKPSGEANVAAYGRSLILQDLQKNTIIIDGHTEEYKVK
mgnify:CR=1 FL=1|jgi:hypothetical protein